MRDKLINMFVVAWTIGMMFILYHLWIAGEVLNGFMR